RIGALSPVATRAAQAETFAWTTFAVVLWVSGALATAALFAWQQWRFQRRLAGSAPHGEGLRIAHGSEGLPAVVGLLRPRIVLPADFDLRYDAGERELILCHERIHVARRDLWANAVAAVLRALFWFNPLLHYAAWRFRRDQELACDERVVAQHPQRRRDYAGAMLKTQMADSSLPVGCHWQASTPLKERIAMLKEHAPKPMRSVVGAALVSLLLIGGGYAAWAAQPEQPQAGPALPGAENTDYTARIEFSENGGEPARFYAYKRFGETFAMVDAAGQGRPSIVATVQPVTFKGKLAFDVDMQIMKDGEVIAMPRVVAKNGETASVRQGKEQNGKFIGISVAFQVAARDANAALQQARPFVPAERTQKLTTASGAQVEIASKNMNPPRYPVAAAQQGIGGRVLLVVDVAADGSVRGVEIEKSEPAGVFDAATLEAVKQWKFEPAFENGKPVAGRVRVPVDFKVEKEDGAGGVVPRSAG
ncbi:MAG TPA: TonB family protein, partial [Pseudoxanthomonas sp.]|nr:TonB family protein [Pseudoxanthomonas sp.]